MHKSLIAVTRTVGRTVLQAKKNSPTVMFVAGMLGVTTGTVLACRATLHLDEVLGKDLDTLEDIKTMQHSSYSEEYRTQDRILVMTSMSVSLVKLYGPSIIIGGLGVACLAGSHNILTKRNAALTAAYAGLERSYAAYRDRIRKEIGEDKECQLHYEVQTEEAVKAKAGNLKHKGSSKFPGYSQYAKFFDEGSSSWSRNAEHNLLFISCQQRYANEVLHAKGHIFLNEVYDSLGIPRTTAGQVVGWSMYGDGDSHVDFGVFDHHTNEVRNFVNGAEPSILLDFNVDGVIYDLIER